MSEIMDLWFEGFETQNNRILKNVKVYLKNVLTEVSVVQKTFLKDILFLFDRRRSQLYRFETT